MTAIHKLSQSNACFVVVGPECPGGEIIAYESRLDMTEAEAHARAEQIQRRTGAAWVVQLPLQVTVSVVRVAGEQGRVRGPWQGIK